MAIPSGKADNEHIPTVFTLKVRGGQMYVMVHRKRSTPTVETSRSMPDFELYARSNSGSCEEKKWHRNLKTQ